MRFRVLDAFRLRGATWSYQAISSPLEPSGGPFMTHLLSGGEVPGVHGARSPVPPRPPLFATPLSVGHLATVAAGAYPLHGPSNTWSPRVPGLPGPCYWLVAIGTPPGLVRRLPSRGAGAWLGVPLLPWRVQCPVRVCTALAAGLGCSGRCRFLCLSRSATPAPRSPRCVWRVVLSGSPLLSIAGTPFHAVCALRGFGLVTLLVFPACPLRQCALSLSRRPRLFSLPGSVWRTHHAWFRCRAPVGPFHVVPAPPRFLPRSRPPSGLLWAAGGGAVRFSPCLELRRVPPCRRACASGAVGRQEKQMGGPVCRPPWGRGRGAPRGGGSLYLGLSLCPPWAGTKAGVIGVAQFMEGVAPKVRRFVSACRPEVWSGGRWCGSACLLSSLWEQTGGGMAACGVRA